MRDLVHDDKEFMITFDCSVSINNMIYDALFMHSCLILISIRKKLVVGRRNKNQYTRKKGKRDNYCRWSVDIESFEYTGFKLQ